MYIPKKFIVGHEDFRIIGVYALEGLWTQKYLMSKLRQKLTYLTPNN